MFVLLGMMLVFLGLVCAALAIREWRRLRLIEGTKTTALADVEADGIYEVVGTVECDDPLVLPSWQTPCVYYTAIIEAITSDGRVIPGLTDTDGSGSAGSGGSGSTGAGGGSSAGAEGLTGRERWRLVEGRTDSCPFRITDEQGNAITIEPEQAELDGPELKSDSRGAENLAGALLKRQAPGHRARVRAIKVGARVYALGKIESVNGKKIMRGGPVFIISAHSEGFLATGKRQAMYVASAAALSCLATGALCLSPLIFIL